MEQLLAQLAQFMDPRDRDLDKFKLERLIAALKKAREARLSVRVDLSLIRVYQFPTPETAEASQALHRELAALDSLGALYDR
ncbi:MAG: hypothetical protein IT406_01175 [Candidatus Yanofskybacteria bacterium]|nr:hypothetical protein [Candidatus Yanofskybacteria bacterium]